MVFTHSFNRSVILNSGGMDSFFMALEDPTALHIFVDVGQKYATKEIQSAHYIAQRHGAPFKAMKGASIGQFEHESGIIPFRNAELILNAAQHGNRIKMGVLKGEINSDKSPEFLAAMKLVLDISHRGQYWTEGREFELVTPLADRTKTDLVRGLWERVGGNNTDPLWLDMLSTISCYSDSLQHCGRCPSCFKRWVALNAATGEDYGGHFARHPKQWHPLAYWESKYDGERIEDIRVAYGV